MGPLEVSDSIVNFPVPEKVPHTLIESGKSLVSGRAVRLLKHNPPKPVAYQRVVVSIRDREARLRGVRSKFTTCPLLPTNNAPLTAVKL